METIKLSDKQIELIQRVSPHFERTGLTPAQARIVVLLLVTDRIELTFDEIRNTLQLSKSATSTALNSLLDTNRISYITKIGDRKRYFRSKMATMSNDFEKTLMGALKIRPIMEEILETRTKDTPDFNDQMQRVIDFIMFLEGELPLLYEKWKQSRNA